MNEKAENTRILLIAQMKRAIELLEGKDITKPEKIHNDGNFKWSGRNGEHSELKSKLHEIRRDSVRFVKECNAK